MKLLPFLIVAGLLSSPLHADEGDRWQVAGMSDSTTFLVDDDTINIAPDRKTRTAWITMVFSQPDKDGANYVKVRERINCEDRSFAITLYAKYHDGELVKSGEDSTGNLRPAVPNSLMEDAIVYACSGTVASSLEGWKVSEETFPAIRIAMQNGGK